VDGMVVVSSGANVFVDAVGGVVLPPAVPVSLPHAAATTPSAIRVATTRRRERGHPCITRNIGRGYSRRSCTSVTRWSAPLRKISEARPFVGAMFSRRLSPLISLQMNLAVATASSWERCA
jgi:hypothetical protein